MSQLFRVQEGNPDFNRAGEAAWLYLHFLLQDYLNIKGNVCRTALNLSQVC